MHYFNLKFPTNRDRNLIRDSSFFYEISSPRHHQALAVPWAKPWWALVEPWAKARSHQGTTKAWAKAKCSTKAWPKGWGLVVYEIERRIYQCQYVYLGDQRIY
jgi:hypothetical protein